MQCHSPAFAPGFPAQLQGRIGFTFRGPGVTSQLGKAMQACPLSTSRTHFCFCTLGAKRSACRFSYLRGGELKMRKTLHIFYPRKFLFRAEVARNWEGSSRRADGRGLKYLASAARSGSRHKTAQATGSDGLCTSFRGAARPTLAPTPLCTPY